MAIGAANMTPNDTELVNTQQQKMHLALWCIIYGAGIIGTLVVYGVLQERIMTIPYGKTTTFGGELFTVSAFLVLCNRCFNCLYASFMIYVSDDTVKPKAPVYKYFIISMSNVAATTCQYECLKYVSFPVQMLGKSFKMMPVMIWGIIISGPMSSPNDNGNSVYGLLLLLGFLGCDGLTSSMQEKLFKEHQTSKFNQMLYVNGCSAVVSLVSVLAMGKMGYCLAFGAAHGAFVTDALSLSAAAAGSQYFIYSQVKEYGALVFAATMNVRQVVSILVSFTTYNHTITTLQAAGLCVIFSALFYKSYASLSSDQKKQGKEIASPEEKKPLIAKDDADEYIPSAPKQLSV